MPRRLAILPVIAVLAACGREEPPAQDAARIADAPPPMPETPPPVTPEPPRYVGRWAASAELCRDGAWTFGERDLATAGEVSCTFSRVTPIAAGYQVDAACQAEGERGEGRLTLAFPATADAMTVTGGPYDWDVALIACPSR